MNKTANVTGKRISLSFPYDMNVIQAVRGITGRKWDAEDKIWTVPYTPWHCQQVLEVLKPFDFTFDEQVIYTADTTAELPELEFPDGVREFQKEAVKFITAVGGRAIIADAMGVGKTIEALVYAKLFSKKILIIVPTNVLYKWEAESIKWVGEKSVGVYPTGKGELGDEDIHIMSYGIMGTRYGQIKETPYDTVIFDEAHMIKNSKAIRTRVAKALVKAGIPNVLFLSGTPFMNRPSELFPLLNMLDPAGYANFYDYARRYCGALYQDGMWYFPPNGVSNTEELAKRLSNIMIRRTSADVLPELPDLTRTSIPIVIDNMAQYKQAAKDIRIWLKENKKEAQNPDHVLTRLNTLRQIVGMGKVPAAVELAESVLQDNRKVVLFAHHKAVVEALQEKIEELGFNVGVISGGTKPRERQRLIQQFLNSNEILISKSELHVMIITVAGAEGIDLFSASDIIFVEREWTPAREEQAEARLHRMGQRNPVTAWYIVAKKTVDEKLEAMIRKKREVFGSIIRQDEILESVLEELE